MFYRTTEYPFVAMFMSINYCHGNYGTCSVKRLRELLVTPLNPERYRLRNHYCDPIEEEGHNDREHPCFSSPDSASSKINNKNKEQNLEMILNPPPINYGWY